MQENDFKIKISKWEELRFFFSERIKTPIDHPEYILYFVVVVIGLGAIGIWSSLSRETENVLLYHADVIASISSFSVAILAAGSIELMFSKNEVIKITLFLITLTLIAIGILGFYFSLKINNEFAYFVAIPVTLFALLVWWIANAENANLTKNFFKEQSKASQDLNESLNQYEEQ
jgi:hypothetical protein